MPKEINNQNPNNLYLCSKEREKSVYFQKSLCTFKNQSRKRLFNKTDPHINDGSEATASLVEVLLTYNHHHIHNGSFP